MKCAKVAEQFSRAVQRARVMPDPAIRPVTSTAVQANPLISPSAAPARFLFFPRVRAISFSLLIGAAVANFCQFDPSFDSERSPPSYVAR